MTDPTTPDDGLRFGDHVFVKAAVARRRVDGSWLALITTATGEPDTDRENDFPAYAVQWHRATTAPATVDADLRATIIAAIHADSVSLRPGHPSRIVHWPGLIADRILAALTSAGWPHTYQPDNPHVTAAREARAEVERLTAERDDARALADEVTARLNRVAAQRDDLRERADTLTRRVIAYADDLDSGLAFMDTTQANERSRTATALRILLDDTTPASPTDQTAVEHVYATPIGVIRVDHPVAGLPEVQTAPGRQQDSTETQEEPRVRDTLPTESAAVLGPQIIATSASPRPDTVINWQGVNFVPQVARCWGCDHTTDMHQPDGCWYTVEHGSPGQNLVCPCSIPRDQLSRADDVEREPTETAEGAIAKWLRVARDLPDEASGVPSEPGHEVTTVRDRIDQVWQRDHDGWTLIRPVSTMFDRRLEWASLWQSNGPLTDTGRG